VRPCVSVCVCMLVRMRLIAVFSMCVYVLSVLDHIYVQTYKISILFGPDQSVDMNLD